MFLGDNSVLWWAGMLTFLRNSPSPSGKYNSCYNTFSFTCIKVFSQGLAHMGSFSRCDSSSSNLRSCQGLVWDHAWEWQYPCINSFTQWSARVQTWCVLLASSV